MSKIQKITPDCQPVFPCWLWSRTALGMPTMYSNGWYRALTWSRYTIRSLEQSCWTHFHPDQTEAPTERPDELSQSSQVGDGLNARKSPEPATLPPEVQAACERLTIASQQPNANGLEPQCAADLHTLLAWVEGRKSQ